MLKHLTHIPTGEEVSVLKRHETRVLVLWESGERDGEVSWEPAAEFRTEEETAKTQAAKTAEDYPF